MINIKTKKYKYIKDKTYWNVELNEINIKINDEITKSIYEIKSPVNNNELNSKFKNKNKIK